MVDKQQLKEPVVANQEQFTIEDKPFDFLDTEALKPPPYTLKRFRSSSGGKQRYYYEMVGDTPILYSSLTTMLAKAYPEEFNALEEWRVSMRVQGKDPDKIAQERADYGTIMHILYGHFLVGKEIPVTISGLTEYLKSDEVDDQSTVEKIVNKSKLVEELVKDLLSFAQWVKDFNVRPLAIELMLRDPDLKVGTPIDLYAEMDLPIKGNFGEVYKQGPNKGLPKESTQILPVRVIVDFKSGKKGFYAKHALQLEIGKRIFLKNYPNEKVDFIYNFSPKDWRTSPSYNFTDQSNSPYLIEIEEVLGIGKKRFERKTKELNIYSGTIQRGKEFDFKNNLTVKTVEEILTEVSKANGSRAKKG